MESSPTDKALRKALQSEGAKFKMPAELAESIMAQVRAEAERKEEVTTVTSNKERRTAQLPRRALWWLSTAAAVLVVAFILTAPRIKEVRERALYEGSYVEADGQRVEEYKRIKGDIQAALAMADQAEDLARQE